MGRKVKSIVATGLALLGGIHGGDSFANDTLKSTQKKSQIELVSNLKKNRTETADFQVESKNFSNQEPEKKYEGIYAGFETHPEKLDRKQIYDIDVADVPVEVLKYGMLKQLNKIRQKKGLKPLKYDEKLEQVAQEFADDEKNFDRWNNPSPHADSKGRGVYRRYKEAGLFQDHIKIVIVNGVEEGYGENLGSISGHTINSLFDDWMSSKGHKEQILSKYHTAVGFAVSINGNIIVHDFGNVKKQ